MRPKLSGQWLGGFTHPAYVFDADMQLHEDNAGVVTGVIVWCMRKAPGEKHKSKIGLTAREFVGGHFDRKQRTITLTTKKIEDPNGLGIDADEYALTLSADGKSLAGGTTAHPGGLGRFNAKLVEPTSPASRATISTGESAIDSSKLLVRLKQVQSFDDAQRGERPGGFSPNYKIYEGLLNSRPLISISKYSSLVDNGSPAAKLYAAMLINAQDGAAGKAAFQKLSTDKSRVSFVSGCCAIEVTVKEIADDFLDKGNYMHFQLPRPAIK